MWAPEPRARGQVFNIGNGAEVSIRDLAEMVTSMTGSASAIRYVPYHKVFGQNFEDMSRRVPDITKIQQLVGYRPRVQLEEILERVIEYWTPQPPELPDLLDIPGWHDSSSLFVH